MILREDIRSLWKVDFPPVLTCAYSLALLTRATHSLYSLAQMHVTLGLWGLKKNRWGGDRQHTTYRRTSQLTDWIGLGADSVKIPYFKISKAPQALVCQVFGVCGSRWEGNILLGSKLSSLLLFLDWKSKFLKVMLFCRIQKKISWLKNNQKKSFNRSR